MSIRILPRYEAVGRGKLVHPFVGVMDQLANGYEIEEVKIASSDGLNHSLSVPFALVSKTVSRGKVLHFRVNRVGFPAAMESVGMVPTVNSSRTEIDVKVTVRSPSGETEEKTCVVPLLFSARHTFSRSVSDDEQPSIWWWLTPLIALILLVVWYLWWRRNRTPVYPKYSSPYAHTAMASWT